MMSDASNSECREFTIPVELAGQRLDKVLAQLLNDYSRSRLQAWLRTGAIRVNGETAVPRSAVQGGERIQARLEPGEHDTAVAPEAIPLDIRHEDDSLLVVNKPAGLVVHPGAGNHDGTLQNALLHHDPRLAELPRAGIVHRLDKDTSGLMVVARTLPAHKYLVDALGAREIKREYEALVQGVLTAGGLVDAPIGRHPVDRKRMDVRPGARPSVTHYRLLQRFHAHTHLRLQLESGRTHQIRVHMQHLRHPIVGDPVYGGRPAPPAGATAGLREVLTGFRRQALHARRLGLTHPSSGEFLTWRADPPDDLRRLLAELEADRLAREAA
ncbi:23S rRNA pseudouridine(1911/1915/1917) synthase RluD [Salinisphaera sp. P385]|uniref:Pseudouridine synthase n=1 Tax=Spectribacter acetivorans TaxID=3075603 RepID=A0ABU3B6B7_9GAMM|nr:23S rRNA pseudouridine(1911/1915/1917) synthase RluD [Salinisphaera sp. P385]MDT0617615.1 23S rRNA pseudouridine(1911/1915/1917) synthase RluD [Salinisphaera sp. P385]